MFVHACVHVHDECRHRDTYENQRRYSCIKQRLKILLGQSCGPGSLLSSLGAFGELNLGPQILQ